MENNFPGKETICWDSFGTQIHGDDLLNIRLSRWHCVHRDATVMLKARGWEQLAAAGDMSSVEEMEARSPFFGLPKSVLGVLYREYL